MTKYCIPYLIIFVAFIMLWNIIIQIDGNVFYSGDGGIKFNYVKQLLDKGFSVTLDNNFPNWVIDLYNKGYSPLNPPFFYRINEQVYYSFPVYFPLISSFMFQWLGYHGLYVIPAFSLLLIWILLYIYLKDKYRFSYSLIILVIFIFATSLTLYGAIFWEHTIATLFILVAFFYITTISNNSPLHASIIGFIASLAIYFRPEALLLLSFLVIFILIFYFKYRKKYLLFFLLFTVLGILSFFTLNYLIYDSIFGIHGLQVLEEEVTMSYLDKLKRINYLFFRFNPSLLFSLILFVYVFIKHLSSYKMESVVFLIIILFCLISPALLPNFGGKQWSARYFLVIIPLFFLNIKPLIKYIESKFFIKGVYLILIIYSVFLNSYQGYNYLVNDYDVRVAKLYSFVDNSKINTVLINNDYILQEMFDQYQYKYFFSFNNTEQYNSLINELKKKGIVKSILISTDKVNDIEQKFVYKEKMGDYYLYIIDINEKV